jgi:hypothetical protein
MRDARILPEQEPGSVYTNEFRGVPLEDAAVELLAEVEREHALDAGFVVAGVLG